MANGAPDSTIGTHQSFSDFVKTHEGLVIGGGLVAILLLAGMFMKKQNTSTPATGTADLSGLQNGNLVYVPTQTNFETINKTQSGVFASNDPALTGITTGPVNSPTTTTNKPPPVIVQSPPPVVRVPPPPPPPPATGGKSFKWDQRHTVLGGETLSSIAASAQAWMRAHQGMPGSVQLTWQDLYSHNTALINKYAMQHGHNTDYWNWIFPGETLVTPRWG